MESLIKLAENNEIVKFMFSPPAPPDLNYGFLGKSVGLAAQVAAAVKSAYFVGVKDGLMWGFILALLVAVVLPKTNIMKRINDVFS